MGALPGNLRGHPTYSRHERMVREAQGDHRADIRNCKRVPHNALHQIYRQGPDGNEGGAYICLYESQKTRKDEEKNGVVGPLF